MTEVATVTLWFRCVGGHVTSVQGATSDTPMWRCTCGDWASRDKWLNSLQSALTASEAARAAAQDNCDGFAADLDAAEAERDRANEELRWKTAELDNIDVTLSPDAEFGENDYAKFGSGDQVVRKARDVMRHLTQSQARELVLRKKAALADRAYGYIKAKSQGKEIPAEATAARLWVKDYDVLTSSEGASEEAGDAL